LTGWKIKIIEIQEEYLKDNIFFARKNILAKILNDEEILRKMIKR